ncbi:MAG: C-type lectin domain-containing protein [Planctomycetota bacterium]
MNDNCANALALPPGYADTAFDATGATTDGTDATGLGLVDYGDFGDEQNHNDVWFTYTPDTTGCTYISTLGLVTWDTRLTVYQGTGCPDDPMNIIAAADDEVRVPALAAPFEAGLDVDLVAGQTYTIRLGTFDASTLPGTGTLRIAAGPGAEFNSGGLNPSAPGCASGDDCSSAVPIAGVGTFNFDLTAATLDGAVDSLCGCQSNSASAGVDAWFLWSPPAEDLYTLSTVGLVGGMDTIVAVHESCSQTSIACDDDSSGGLESETRFRGLAGETYLIRIASGASATLGMGQFSITAGATLPLFQTTGFFEDKQYILLSPSSWPDAQLAAEELGGSLVTVDNQAEQDFILNTFQTSNLDIWLGLNDRETEGLFEWVDGSVSAYRSFATGEPNSGSPGGEDFVHISAFLSGNWNDAPGCNNRNSLVEIPRPFFTESCFGDGGDQMGCTDCPCSNNAPIGSRGGCLNSAGQSARLLVSGVPDVFSDSLRFEMTGATSNSFAILSSGAAIAPANAANPCFGLNTGIQSPTFDGLRCAVQAIQRHGARATSSSGTVGLTTPGWGCAERSSRRPDCAGWLRVRSDPSLPGGLPRGGHPGLRHRPEHHAGHLGDLHRRLREEVQEVDRFLES